MAIANVTERDGAFFIYDERGHQLGFISAFDAKLVGFTSTSVSIERNNGIYTYDETGRQISARAK